MAATDEVLDTRTRRELYAAAARCRGDGMHAAADWMSRHIPWPAVDEHVLSAVLELLADGKNVQAVTHLRKQTGWDLFDAKTYVEVEVQRQLRARDGRTVPTAAHSNANV